MVFTLVSGEACAQAALTSSGLRGLHSAIPLKNVLLVITPYNINEKSLILFQWK